MHPSLLQFDRAAKHLKELEIEVSKWLNGDHHTIVTQPDPEPGYYVVIASADPVPLDPFGVIISDTLHGLRSGLDHVAYALAQKFTVPLTHGIAKNSQFPIFGDRAGFQAKRHYIRGINPAAQTIIESLQPYHRGNQFRSDPLWKLNELSNIDKHRLLHPVIFHTAGARIVIAPGVKQNWRLGRGAIVVRGVPVEQNTQVLRFPAEPVDPSKEMNMDFQPNIHITFPQGSAAEKEGVAIALTAIYDHIMQRVIPPLMPFL